MRNTSPRGAVTVTVRVDGVDSRSAGGAPPYGTAVFMSAVISAAVSARL